MISNLILPKISSKIKIVKTNIKTGKIEVFKGHNTIRKEALYKMTGIGTNSTGSNESKILAGIYDNNYVEDLSNMNLSLLKSDRFNERSQDRPLGRDNGELVNKAS